MLNKEILIIINEIRNNQNNQNRCFECEMIYPNYISTNNGLFLCFVCASFLKKHLDKEHCKIVEIKQINIIELQNGFDYLFCGGNKRFTDFLEIYELKSTLRGETINDILKDKNFISKYKTVAAKYYREVLDNEVKGVIIANNNSLPSFEDGNKIINCEINIIKEDDENKNVNVDDGISRL